MLAILVWLPLWLAQTARADAYHDRLSEWDYFKYHPQKESQVFLDCLQRATQELVHDYGNCFLPPHLPFDPKFLGDPRAACRAGFSKGHHRGELQFWKGTTGQEAIAGIMPCFADGPDHPNLCVLFGDKYAWAEIDFADDAASLGEIDGHEIQAIRANVGGRGGGTIVNLKWVDGTPTAKFLTTFPTVIAHILGTDLYGWFDRYLPLRIDPPADANTELKGYAMQDGFHAKCHDEKKGVTCMEFSDGFRWEVPESRIYSSAVLKSADGSRIEVKRGCSQDYYHVLHTRMVKTGLIPLDLSPPSVPKPSPKARLNPLDPVALPSAMPKPL